MYLLQATFKIPLSVYTIYHVILLLFSVFFSAALQF